MVCGERIGERGEVEMGDTGLALGFRMELCQTWWRDHGDRGRDPRSCRRFWTLGSQWRETRKKVARKARKTVSKKEEQESREPKRKKETQRNNMN